jgi:hypothetical protein
MYVILGQLFKKIFGPNEAAKIETWELSFPDMRSTRSSSAMVSVTSDATLSPNATRPGAFFASTIQTDSPPAESWNRCYGFENIFDEKLFRKIGVFRFNYCSFFVKFAS